MTKLSERMLRDLHVGIGDIVLSDIINEASALEARIEALEMERDEWEAATRNLLEHYPEDVFPPNSNTPDAKAGTFARRLLGCLLDPVERTRLAALRSEEGK